VGGDDTEQVEGLDSEAPELNNPVPGYLRILVRQMIESEMLEEVEAKAYMRSELHVEIMAASGRINDRIVADLRDLGELLNSEPFAELDPTVLSTIHWTIADGPSELYELTGDQYSNLLDGMVEALLEKVPIGKELPYCLSF
jgi:hypothetical protein